MFALHESVFELTSFLDQVFWGMTPENLHALQPKYCVAIPSNCMILKVIEKCSKIMWSINHPIFLPPFTKTLEKKNMPPLFCLSFFPESTQYILINFMLTNPMFILSLYFIQSVRSNWHICSFIFWFQNLFFWSGPLPDVQIHDPTVFHFFTW